MIIKNRGELLSHGNIRARKSALDIIDRAMERIDASRLTRELVQCQNEMLKVGSCSFDLSRAGDIFVLGAGKAVLQIAEALEQVLGDRISQGVVVEKRLDGMPKGLARIKKFKRIQVLQASHPVPDEAAVKGAQKILAIAEQATAKEVVIFCVQGGCTCLTTLPAPGLTLEDLRQTTQVLLESGADIVVLNAVRNALTVLSSGRLAQYIHPATIINLVVNDYVLRYPQAARGGRYGAGWGPAVPVSEQRRLDFAAALAALDDHGLWARLPEPVADYLKKHKDDRQVLTTGDFSQMGIRQHTFVLADPQDAAEAASRAAEDLGLNALVLSSCLEGEAREVGIMLAGIAVEIARNRRPVPAPCAVLCAGEKTVTITGPHGEGGRNQECALSAAQRIDGAHQIVIASVGTDGTDGPTGIAGGIVDGYTLERARENGIGLAESLKSHSSAQALGALGDAIYFNEPGNNVCDLSVIVVDS